MRPSLLAPFVLAISLVANPAAAQFSPGAPTGKMMVVMMPDVQKELKLTGQQKKDIQAAVQAIANGGYQATTDISQMSAQMDGKVLAGLTPDQLSRLTELWIQYNGPKALLDPSVAQAVQLTDDQKTKIKAIWDDYGQAIMDAMRQNGQTSAMKAIKGKKKDAEAGTLALLTSDQMKAFADVQGKPHKFPYRPDF